MSQVLSLRIPDRMAERLERFARRQGNGMTRNKAGILLLEEALREAEFALIEYRDSPIRRQPYMKSSGLSVWEVIIIARRYGLNAERMAQDYPHPVENIKASLNFYEAYQDEIDQAIEDNSLGYEGIKQLSNVHLFEVPTEALNEKPTVMLSLLLDENISPEVAKKAVMAKRPDIPITSVYFWHEGRFMAALDTDILSVAAQEGITLVTYDQKNIIPVLVQWGQVGTNHAGVIFVDERSIASNNFGELVRSLIALWRA